MSDTKLPLTTKEARKKDALALAELIYDMFKEEERRKAIIKVSHD